MIKKQERSTPASGTRKSYKEDIAHKVNSKVYEGFGQAWTRRALLRIQ